MWRGVFLIILLAWASVASAHNPGISSLNIKADAQGLQTILTFAPADIDVVVPLDRDLDGTVSSNEIAAANSQLEALSKTSLQILTDGKKVSAEQVRFQFDDNNNFQIFLTFPLASYHSVKLESTLLKLLPPGHEEYFTLQDKGGQIVQEDLIDAHTGSFELHLAPVKNLPPRIAKSFLEFLVLGVEHILTGYDHLLFLFGLLLVCENFRSVLKIVTCFTIAHSLTLTLATLNIVHLPGRLVEPIIAASIVYVGVENFISKNPKGRWLLTFAFGLIHGFGFASVLEEMGIGKGASVALPLFSFNLGVELGQISIAAIVLPVLWRLKQKESFSARWVPACSLLIVILGSYWFIERVWFS